MEITLPFSPRFESLYTYSEKDRRGGKAPGGVFFGFSLDGVDFCGLVILAGNCFPGLTPRITFWTETYPGNMALFRKDKQFAFYKKNQDYILICPRLGCLSLLQVLVTRGLLEEQGGPGVLGGFTGSPEEGNVNQARGPLFSQVLD